MKPSSKTKVWSNADVALQAVNTAAAKEAAAVGIKAKAVVQAVQSKRHGGEGVFLAKTHVKFEDSDDDDAADEYQTLPTLSLAEKEEEKEEEMAGKKVSGNTDAYAKARVADDDEVCFGICVFVVADWSVDGRIPRLIGQRRTQSTNQRRERRQ